MKKVFVVESCSKRNYEIRAIHSVMNSLENFEEKMVKILNDFNDNDPDGKVSGLTELENLDDFLVCDIVLADPNDKNLYSLYVYEVELIE